MVKVSTLYHRVDDFNNNNQSIDLPVFLDQEEADTYLNNLLKPLVFDPDDEIVQKVLKHV